MLVIQPTGSGKLIIFQCFSVVFDVLHGKRNTSCPLVISPLTSLMQDQVAYLTSLGDEQSDETVKKIIKKNIKSCSGLQSCFWVAVAGIACYRVPHIAKSCPSLP